MEHFSNVLHHPPVSLDRDLEASSHAAEPSLECSTDPVTVDEVEKAEQLLKNNRAPGFCKITSEMLKAGGDNIIRWKKHIINEVWHSENLPEDWIRRIILPFWKRKGDKLVCSNHRGITLLSIPGKDFTYSVARVLLGRSLPAISCYRRPQQVGFLPNRSTIDQISSLRLIIEKTREFRKGRHLYLAFIDLKAAFDSVDHASLWAILACIGVPGKILRLFKKLNGDSQSCVRINGKLSEWFNINSGVRQGCVAAPDLFNCVVDHPVVQ